MSRILIADDHPLNRHFLTTLLTYHGYEIEEAADGEEALQSARRRKPDLIIADVLMPRMDGAALVRALRADPALAPVPVVFYSASYREHESRAIAKASGVEHVISKPADPEVILDTVHRVLGDPERAAIDVGRTTSDEAKEYLGRLQLASIRMSALIDLSLHLSTQRDAGELLSTACRAMRTIFSADYAVIAVGSQPDTSWAADGSVDGSRLNDLFESIAPFTADGPTRMTGEGEPLVTAARKELPGVWSTLLLPMAMRNRLYGWMLLGKKRDAHPFTLDDERLALTAASQIRAEHDSLRAELRERERMEAELRATREDLSALVDAAPVAIVGFDSSLAVRSWNAAAERMFGWTSGEVIGQPMPALAPELRDEFASAARETLQGKIVTGLEQRRTRKDGEQIDVSLAMAPLHDHRRGFVSIISDVTEVRASRQRLRALAARMLSMQEEKRTHIARELHDVVGQLLTAIKIDVSRLLKDVAQGTPPSPQLTESLVPLIDSAMDAVVRVVSEVRPSGLGEMGLAAAIEKKVAELRERTGIAVDLAIDPALPALPDDLATAVFRITEESLTNVARHSGATHAAVELSGAEGELVLEVRDNGRGIRESERVAPDAYGLMGMKERAAILGGTVEITAAEQRGTVVAARFPLRHDPRAHR